ncbi:hypothetical protein [Nocardia ignorata]|uniref:Uncharacterized protein n=1 Tax=Nocardia ignorata TaxID=145285 RepID=A0A4V3CMJ9_NOCIG|nr:hypothetical protein [Nocardia ignorata]TDP29894.1 hypothetical protein DFR75_112163 [Nocardia ignorata]
MTTPLGSRSIDTKRYRWRKANGIAFYTNAAPVQRHLDVLAALNVTPQMVGYVVGVDRQTIQNIPNQQQVNTHLASRILAVSHHPHPAQHRVLAIGAARRLGALSALGWPRRVLAARLGIDSSLVSQLFTQCHTSYTRWLAVKALYEELSATRGPSNHVASTARRAGHVPPLAWEGIDIDHPLAEPDWVAVYGECRHGHLYSPENTMRRIDGSRACRVCHRAGVARSKANKRALAQAAKPA